MLLQRVKSNASIASEETSTKERRTYAIISSMTIAFLIKDIISLVKTDFIEMLFCSLSLEGIGLCEDKDQFMKLFKKSFPENTFR